MQIAVLGSGGWGTALGLLLHQNGHQVALWSPFAAEAAQLDTTRENPLLPGVTIPADITCTAEISLAFSADLIVFATPSFAVRKTAELIRGKIKEGTPLVIVSKGIETKTFYTFDEVLAEVLGASVKTCALSGPSHAEEVARGIPTACVAASRDLQTAEFVQGVFMNARFRVYTSTDIIGVELGAALKNIIALAAGACDGLGYGDNTIAALMTRGLDEMSALAAAMGGKRETLSGLAGLGDLIVTCTSRHSRNRRAGVYIGQGLSVDEAMKRVGAVVEGYYATESAWTFAQKHHVTMPIIEELYQVLYNGRDPELVLPTLMAREKKSENS